MMLFYFLMGSMVMRKALCYTHANFVLEDWGSYEKIYNNGKVELNSHRNMVNTTI